MQLENIYDVEQTEAVRRTLRLDPQIIRTFRTAAFKRFENDDYLLQNFSQLQQTSNPCLEIAQRLDSEVDGATKLLLRTRSGKLIESVILRITTGRTTLCVSSQVGCAAACEFCATGKMGMAQSLTTQEILEQIRLVGQILSKEETRLRNIVFMGMGEPFHNEENLCEAIDCLTSPKFFNVSPTRLLVSTVGIPAAMVRFAKRFPAVNLALSLHSVRTEVRERIIPLAKKYPLNELRSAIQEANDVQEKPVMIEYLMLAGLNDSLEDAELLVEWLAELDVHVNLIPYNSIDDAPQLVASPQSTIQDFATRLKDAGQVTTVRYSLGADIAAACGQLVRRENRRC